MIRCWEFAYQYVSSSPPPLLPLRNRRSRSSRPAFVYSRPALISLGPVPKECYLRPVFSWMSASARFWRETALTVLTPARPSSRGDCTRDHRFCPLRPLSFPPPSSKIALEKNLACITCLVARGFRKLRLRSMATSLSFAIVFFLIE